MPTLATIKFKYIYQLALPSLFLLFARLNPHGGISATEQLAGKSFWECPFFYWTGFSCPGCGLTRSFIAFFSRDLEGSFYFHPLGPLIGALAVVLWIGSFFVNDISLAGVWARMPNSFRHRMTMSALVTLLSWGILSNLLDLH
jgi:hypothetical protein